MTFKAPTRPIALALELSQRTGSIAVCSRSGETVVHVAASGKRDDDEVMPAIALAVEELELRPSDVELIVVSIGPGGFTGLRTSTAIAKMVSFATGAKIVAVQSAIAVAASSNCGDGPFLIVSSVKEEGFWLSRVKYNKGDWVCESGISSSDELDEQASGVVAVFADEYLPNGARRYFVQHNIPIKEIVLDAGALLGVGLRLHDKGEYVGALDLLPLYPREPEAVRKWNTERQKR